MYIVNPRYIRRYMFFRRCILMGNWTIHTRKYLNQQHHENNLFHVAEKKTFFIKRKCWWRFNSIRRMLGYSIYIGCTKHHIHNYFSVQHHHYCTLFASTVIPSYYGNYYYTSPCYYGNHAISEHIRANLTWKNLHIKIIFSTYIWFPNIEKLNSL